MKIIAFLAIAIVFFIPLSFCDNGNDSLENGAIIDNGELIENATEPAWHEAYLEKIAFPSNMGILWMIIGLAVAYFAGKVAFKLIKFAILIMIIIFVLRIVFGFLN